MANEEMIPGLHRDQWPVASGGTSGSSRRCGSRSIQLRTGLLALLAYFQLSAGLHSTSSRHRRR
jgi:hypothetical protein